LDYLDILKQFGPFLGFVVFFIWRDWKREERLSSRIEVLEREHREVIIPLVEKSTEAIVHNTQVIERFERALEARGA
jgi:hypothetical protein